MAKSNLRNPSRLILEKALASGASLAGIVRARDIHATPSHRGNPVIQRRFEKGSLLILALAHPAAEPSLDWWDGTQGTRGNRKLIHIARRLRIWLKKDLGIASLGLPYYMEKGGLYLKDAAVMAGLGVIGKNNLLVTPDHGPRVRLKAMLLDGELAAAAPLDFAPCDSCPAPCRTACPQKAFAGGSYDRDACNVQMMRNEVSGRSAATSGGRQSRKVCIRYCRSCELSCPVPYQADAVLR